MKKHTIATDSKTALVTGAAHGIGRCYALRLAAAGYDLVLAGDRREPLEVVRREIGTTVRAAAEVRIAEIALARTGAAEELHAFTEREGIAVDVLINNAQASASGVTLADHTTEQFDLAVYSGLYAAFYYMKACYPYLKETKGSVINFASGAGLFGNFGQCAYAAAKEGIRGLTRVAATEWGPDGINVNVVCPLAWTAQLENFEKAYPEAFKANVKMPPMGHYGNVETEIGRVCVQLASPDFKFMTGETLTLEGGLGQRP